MVNDTAENQGVVGDQIVDFGSGNDKFEFRGFVFDPGETLGNGAINSDALSVIGVEYNGLNGTSNDFLDGFASFIVDSTNTLYYDPDGNDPGYRVAGSILGDVPAAGDIEILVT